MEATGVRQRQQESRETHIIFNFIAAVVCGISQRHAHTVRKLLSNCFCCAARTHLYMSRCARGSSVVREILLLYRPGPRVFIAV